MAGVTTLLVRLNPVAKILISVQIMGFDRASAGYAMIGADYPLEVEKMKWGGRFYNVRGGKFSACLETARQTGKDQKCTIAVPAPAH